MSTIHDNQNRIITILNGMVNALSKYPEFEFIKKQINKEKDALLEHINKPEGNLNNKEIELYVSKFETTILELFSSFRLRKKKTNNLKGKLIQLLIKANTQDTRYNQNITNMMHTLEDSYNDENYNQIYLENFKNIKSLEKEINSYEIQKLERKLSEAKNNKIKALQQTNSLDSITIVRINMLDRRISRLLILCKNGIIKFNDLALLYDYDFSKENEYLVEALEEIINIPNNTNIFIDLNSPYDCLNPFNHLSINNSQNSNDDDFTILHSYQSLEDFFYKADLIGGEALFIVPMIVIAKCDNIYLLYEPKEEQYYITNPFFMDITYTENNNHDPKTQKILEEIDNYDIEAIKQRIINYVRNLEDDYNKDANTDLIKRNI